MEKKCSKCKEVKDIENFSKHGKGRQSFCKDCNNLYTREHYKKNKHRYRERNIRRRKERNEWFNEVKSNLSCITCGEDSNYCLDFHHRDPEVKERNIGETVNRGWSKKRILEEIEKCDVLCANCHRKVHAGNNWRVVDW